MLCSQAEREITKLTRSVENLIEELQEKQAQLDKFEPVFDYVGQLVRLWEPFYDRLADGNQTLIRIYQRAIKEVEK